MKKAPVYVIFHEASEMIGVVGIKRIDRSTGAYRTRWYPLTRQAKSSFRLGELLLGRPSRLLSNNDVEWTWSGE